MKRLNRIIQLRRSERDLKDVYIFFFSSSNTSPTNLNKNMMTRIRMNRFVNTYHNGRLFVSLSGLFMVDSDGRPRADP